MCSTTVRTAIICASLTAVALGNTSAKRGTGSADKDMSTFKYQSYIPDYEQYQDVNRYMRFAKFMQDNHAPAKAEDCNTTEQLDAWRSRMEAPMHAFIPKAYQSYEKSAIKKEYKKNAKRIAKKDEDAQNLPATPVRLLLAAGDLQQQAAEARARADAAEAKAEAAAGKQSAPSYRSYMPSSQKAYVPLNVSEFDYERFVPDYEKYADVQKYMDFNHMMSKLDAPSSAEKCNTTAQLDAWRKAQEAPVKAFIPKQWQSESMHSIKEEYAKNKARIQKASDDIIADEALAADSQASARKLLATAGDLQAQAAEARAAADAAAAKAEKAEEAKKPDQPGQPQNYEQYIPKYAKYMDVQKYMKFQKFEQGIKAPYSAADCKTKDELDAWRAKKEAPIEEFIPKEYQQQPMDSVQKEYDQNLKRIKAGPSQMASEPKGDEPISTKKSSSGSGFHWPLALTARFAGLHAQSISDSDTKEFMPTNTHSAQVQKYVPRYANYMDVQKFETFRSSVEQQKAPARAANCTTMKELDAWFKKEKAIVKEFVPAAYTHYPLRSLEKKYKENAARIEAMSSEQLLAVPTTVGSHLIMCALVMMMAGFAGVAVSVALRWRRGDSPMEENLLVHDAPCAV